MYSDTLNIAALLEAIGKIESYSQEKNKKKGTGYFLI